MNELLLVALGVYVITKMNERSAAPAPVQSARTFPAPEFNPAGGTAYYTRQDLDALYL